MSDNMHEMNNNSENDQLEKKQKRLGTARRVVAWAGIVMIVAMYIITFISSLTQNAASSGLFKASLVMTIVIPVLMWGITIFMKRD